MHFKEFTTGRLVAQQTERPWEWWKMERASCPPTASVSQDDRHCVSFTLFSGTWFLLDSWWFHYPQGLLSLCSILLCLRLRAVGRWMSEGLLSQSAFCNQPSRSSHRTSTLLTWFHHTAVSICKETGGLGGNCSGGVGSFQKKKYTEWSKTLHVATVTSTFICDAGKTGDPEERNKTEPLYHI